PRQADWVSCCHCERFFEKQSHLSKTRLLSRKNLLAMTRTRQADGELNPKTLNKKDIGYIFFIC
ncbi:MAG TPA: hypothetical protein DEP72_00030, partial [Clostridiales bacterium]|nr:hypothetical protein [Clostridiales bacterium]